MTIKISEKLFKGIYKWLFVVMIAFLPQFAFLGSYINNDSLALFSISIIIYSWILGIENKWNTKTCILLGFGIGICSLSYYNAYGYILISFFIFIISNIIIEQKLKWKELFKKGCIIAGIALIIAGWWFIRSAIIYNGDFLGLTTETEYSEKYAMQGFKPSERETPQNKNLTLWYMLKDMDWIKITYYSFVGVFGYMSILMPSAIYIGYFLLFSGAFIGFLIGLKKILWYCKKEDTNKQKILLNYSFIFAIIIPIMLSIYYSYTSDFQPQGRYIMPMLIPFMYFVVYGIQTILEKIINLKKIKEFKIINIIKNILIILLIVIIVVIAMYCLIKVVIPYYKNLK